MPPATRQIGLPDWTTNPALARVIDALGAEHVRFVGGCVRDSLAGRTVKDIDLATSLLPETVTERLAAAGLRAVDTGISHGTVTAVSNGDAFEVTTLRIDRETDGRHAIVTFTDDWVADAARRDFTINAISLSLDGVLHDPFDGEVDLAAGRIRFVGDPSERIREDYLRLLRLFRFHAHFGRGKVDEKAMAAVRELAPGLKRISAERIGDELLRLLAAPDPRDAMTAMRDAGVLGVALPEAGPLSVLTSLLESEREAGLEPDPLLRLAAMPGGGIADLPGLAGRLRLSNADRGRIALYLRLAETVRGAGAERGRLSLLRALQHDGPAAVTAGLIVARARLAAGAGDGPDSQEKARLLHLIKAWQEKDFPLSGKDLVAAGISPGPELGELLQTLEDWWLEQDRVPDRAACLAELERRRG